MTKMTFLDEPPPGDELTDYDRQQLVTYLRLLDAEAEGADWRDVASVIFGLNPEVEPERVRRVHATHLARAQWVRDAGFRHLLDQSKQ